LFDRTQIAARASAAGIAAAKFLLLAALTLVAFAALKLGNFPNAPAPVRRPAPLTRLFPKTDAKPEDAPKVFAAESAMSSTALVGRWAPFIAEASLRFGVPETWIRAVIRQESGGRTVTQGDAPITSDAGAEGLMQVMPDTYDEMKAQYTLGDNAYDPHDNIIAGTAYLSWLKKRYGFPRMFAAYNDGPGNFDHYLSGKRGLPAETVAYLADVSATLGARTSRRRVRTVPA
jgi:soluble lytic murein transglycosylase-like protein